MPGSGKSTVGVLLAKALGYEFIDTDLVLQRREGALLQDILDNRGVEAFLDAEEAAVRDLDCAKSVIAPGGSVVCRSGGMARLKELGPVVYLHVPLPELIRRVDNITTRGIAMAPGPDLGRRVRPAGAAVPAVRRRHCGSDLRRRSGGDGGGGAGRL